VIASIIRALLESLARLFYPQRTVAGSERIPHTGPVIFVGNHPNALLDPVMIRIATGRPVRFLAKSTLWDNPFGRVAMEAFGCIPVLRAQEAGGRAGDVRRNEETFARCRAELARGGAVALFPEGTSHSDSRMRELKTGAARIALGAESASPGVIILPVGLHFEDKSVFRSRVLLVVGEPIPVAPFMREFARDERATVESLTGEIREGLNGVVMQAETRELLEGVAAIASWTRALGAGTDLSERNRRARAMLAAYARLQESDPARVDAVASDARRYARMLRRLGIRDPWALELAPVPPLRMVIKLARLVVELHAAIVGAILSWVPYRLAGLVAARVARTEDVVGTVKLLAGMLFLFIAWTLESAAFGMVFGWWWSVPTFLGIAGCSFAALNFQELWNDVREGWRYLWLRAARPATVSRLAARRRELADQVAAALRS
jgi:1-acyl-sn-glycerol-3-phosphate acyltransferase